MTIAIQNKAVQVYQKFIALGLDHESAKKETMNIIKESVSQVLQINNQNQKSL